MFDILLKQISEQSHSGSIYLFNTGMSSMVKNGCNDYLDPETRGHIISWSLKAIEIIAKKYDFIVRKIKGKNFTFVLEYSPGYNKKVMKNITDRVWTPLEENIQLLHSDNLRGSLKTFGRASIREFI